MIRRAETWLALIGVGMIVCGVLAATPALLIVGVGLVGLPAVLGAYMDAPHRTDAPGGYLSAVIAAPSAEQRAIQRYVTNPDAEVADLERDLDRVMRMPFKSRGAGNFLP